MVKRAPPCARFSALSFPSNCPSRCRDNRQPEARALPWWLGGEERREELRQHVDCDARSVVVDEQLPLSVLERQTQPHRAKPRLRLAGVQQQIDEHLRERTCLGAYPRGLGTVDLDTHLGVLFHRRHHLHAAVDDGPEIERLRLAPRGTAHLEQPAHDGVDSFHLGFDAIDDLEGLVVLLSAQPKDREVPENARERVAHLVSDACCQLPHRRQSISRHELGLKTRLLISLLREFDEPTVAARLLFQQRATKTIDGAGDAVDALNSLRAAVIAQRP